MRQSLINNVREAFAECNKLRAENKKLRAVLETLAIAGEQGMKPDYKDWLCFHDKVAKIAREALAN